MSGFPQNASGVAKITSGTIDGVTIGGTTRATSVTSAAYVGTGNKAFTGSVATQFLNIAYAATGTNTGAFLQHNGIAVNDEVAAPNSTLYGLQVADGIGGGGTGLRTAIFGHQITTTFAAVGPGVMTPPQAFYCGVEGRVDANVSLGGSAASSTFQGTNGAALSTLITLGLNSIAGWPTGGGTGLITTSGGTQAFTYTGVDAIGVTLTGCVYQGTQSNTVATGAAVAGNPCGSYWGGLSYGAIIGGTGHQQVYGHEFDVSVAAGSDVQVKIGNLVVATVSDKTRGSVVDAAWNVTNQLGCTTTWQNGILFGQPGKAFPFANDSTIIGATGTGTLNAAKGIDFSAVTFATSSLALPGFSIGPTGPSVFAAGAKYLVIDGAGVVRVSALGPAS